MSNDRFLLAPGLLLNVLIRDSLRAQCCCHETFVTVHARILIRCQRNGQKNTIITVRAREKPHPYTIQLFCRRKLVVPNIPSVTQLLAAEMIATGVVRLMDCLPGTCVDRWRRCMSKNKRLIHTRVAAQSESKHTERANRQQFLPKCARHIQLRYHNRQGGKPLPQNQDVTSNVGVPRHAEGPIKLHDSHRIDAMAFFIWKRQVRNQAPL